MGKSVKKLLFFKIIVNRSHQDVSNEIGKVFLGKYLSVRIRIL